MNLRVVCLALSLIVPLPVANAQTFSCPSGQADIMRYFAMGFGLRGNHFMSGSPNPIYTEVFPNRDFASQGYWFWLKSPKAHGFDVKSFDQNYIYMRSTEWQWTDNTTFKRFENDLPIAARCVREGEPGPQIKVRNTAYRYF